ncbi:class I SAM-dependent methyltransferase [Nitrosococcus watsonii]|uniref:Methyltransferase type 12 n=1 Tax=Nitrosococcus watsoni (strain C-113) TaxID=105559 RepID=D8K9U8_NITWC|nr:class I SAM-dependent methyltransferase [Nitrosococcus watsonii]ADJ29306.1 Methyltransferase type 12 [Nitrosococcus watsonii C-113]
MTHDIKNIIKAITPPIILSGVKAVFLSKDKKEEEEKDSSWYDASFEKDDYWKCHYSLSHYYFLWTVISDRIVRAKIDSILEIGCGSGQLACLIRDKGVKEYHGFDFSPKRIIQAENACPEFNFSEQDAFKTDLFTTCDYSAVVCTEFLEHVEDDIGVLNRIRSGAKFYGTVPNFPFESHVRHFKNESEVLARYRKCFQDLRVDVFLANDRGKTFYLIEGKII